MKLAIDLHSHSGYAGGVGQIKLEDICKTMKFKGIDIFGTGDCLLPARMEDLKNQLSEFSEGIYFLPQYTGKFLLQTEVIISVQLIGYKNRTVAHHLVLFPDFGCIEKMQVLMDKWGMKNTIGRPFIVCKNQKQLEERLFEISAIHPLMEIIPAHVMTPDGILGSKNMLTSIKEFYGNYTEKIRIIETGLSADPELLSTIPDLQNLTMISNSDCHSAALNRIGREFTVIETKEITYSSIISSLRQNNVLFTAEFNPSEGRYFLTGHKKNRHLDKKEVIFENQYPENLLCPHCGKKMTLGVKQRCQMLQSSNSNKIERKFFHLIPLVEVIAFALNLKSIKSKKVTSAFYGIMDIFSSEIALWQTDKKLIIKKLENKVDKNIIRSILSIKEGNFEFLPAGFDGQYGILKIKK